MIARRLRPLNSVTALQTPCRSSLALHGEASLIAWKPRRSRQPLRGLAVVRDVKELDELWFSGNAPRLGPEPREPEDCNNGGSKPPDDRTLRLGNTVRTLHERLPSLLASPLPQDILSPHISLHLFPSTHPHLPTVTGRISYTAALWTAPMAWGRVPVVGNVRLIILSERMHKNGPTSPPFRSEKLIIRWRTCGGGKDGGVDKITEVLQGHEKDDEEFTGLFIFEFDEEGRIARHTIEHVQQGGNFEKMTRVVSVTDWLLGLAKRQGEGTPGYALGYCETDDKDVRRRAQHGHRQ